MTTFPAGLYHFFECYNCEFIISVDQGKYFYSKTFLNCIKIEIYYQMLNPENLKNLYFFQTSSAMISFHTSRMISVVIVENNLPSLHGSVIMKDFLPNE